MTTTLAGLTPTRRVSRPRLLAALLAVSVALNLCFVAGAVWTRLNPPPVLSVSERFHRLAKSLDLSPPQQTAFDQYVAGMLARGDRVRQAVEPLLDNALDEMAKPDADQARVLGLLDEAGTRRREFQREAVSATLTELATLTPDQRAKFITSERTFRAAQRRRRAEETR
jgi:hypothetical protein